MSGSPHPTFATPVRTAPGGRSRPPPMPNRRKAIPPKAGPAGAARSGAAPAKRRTRRVRQLSPEEVAAIAEMIRDWEEPGFGWEPVCAAVQRRFGYRWTRQALKEHAPIYREFVKRSDVGKAVRGRVQRDPAAQLERRTEWHLRNRIAELERERDALALRMGTWVYNAQRMMWSLAELDKQIPPPEKAQTDGPHAPQPMRREKVGRRKQR
ncbi:hypothetical protein ILT44_15820 [Microvirga sp. BT689]|uniref:hypothetical protein n=1 Tax=Microvirga arvi TaxID=2778731 RepID=UPI00194EA326|nr:hypothetical protein [Microvirga arvi]MBM6581665.1 hypothetical protein [Microvirga arvi]